jgi:alpha-tubulin suppressor-like RCC1 family protein
MSQIMEKFDVLNKLNDKFKQRVKILYVFEDDEDEFNVLIVTKDEKTFAFGENSNNRLGFGHNEVVNEIQIVKELCDQQIIDFANGSYHCIARNSSGKVYSWGWNSWGCLGIGSEDESFHKPKLNQYLNNEFVTDISCGFGHSLVLTNCGEVYAWGSNYYGQIGNGCNNNQVIPIKVKGFNNERVVMISCGWGHSMALTECGHVYSWGANYSGQLGVRKKTLNSPTMIKIKNDNKINLTFKKISCGHSHSLLLSEEGVIYTFGSNDCGQLGIENTIQKFRTPKKLPHPNKFINIKCHFSSDISIALSESNVFHIWGKCKKENIYYPREVKSESFDDIFAEYLKITYRALDMEELLKAETKCGNGRYSEEFKEMNLIAVGSYGIVCKAMYKKNNELFAIKKIPIEKSFEEKALKEIAILPKLKSEFIVRLESAWIEDNYIRVDDYKSAENSSLKPNPEIFKAEKTLLLHIQMELCSKTLKDLIKQLNEELNQKPEKVMTPLGYYISSELFIEILESVDYLHKQKVIHRDLKPTNILITDGKKRRFVKIADFGLATIHEFEGQSHTKYSGTPKYRAPEVNSKNKYDLKADIYSLGYILQDLFNFDVNE